MKCQKDKDLVTEDRKQRRINMENEYLNQIDLEEAAVDDFFPVLTRVEEIQPDVMTNRFSNFLHSGSNRIHG